MVESIQGENMDDTEDLITVYVDGTVFETSRDLLTKQSGLFREILTSDKNSRNPNVVTLRGLNTEAFDIALQWMEGFHKVIINKDNVQPIYKVARRLQIPELELKCRRIVGSQCHIRGGANESTAATAAVQPPENVKGEQPSGPTNGKGGPPLEGQPSAEGQPPGEQPSGEPAAEKKEEDEGPQLISEEVFGDIVELPEPPEIPPNRVIVHKREGEMDLRRNYVLARQPDVHVIERDIPEPRAAPPPSAPKKGKKPVKPKKIKAATKKKKKVKKPKKEKKPKKPPAAGPAAPCEPVASDVVNRCRPCGTAIYWNIDPECVLHQQLLRTREGSELPMVFPRAAVPSETNLLQTTTKTFRTRQLPTTGPLARRQPDRVVRIIVGDVTFPVDRNRLIKHSRRLSCMLQAHREVVPESLVIRGVTVEGFQEVAHWLNGDCLELTPCNILMVAEVARRLDMPELINACQSYLDSVNKGEKLQKIIPYYPDYDTTEFRDPPVNSCSLQQACPSQMEVRMEASGINHKRRLPLTRQSLRKRTKGSGDEEDSKEDEDEDVDDDDEESSESEEPSTDEEKKKKAIKNVRATKSETNLAVQLKEKLWNTIKGQFYRNPTDTKDTVKAQEVSKIHSTNDITEEHARIARPVSGRERSFLCQKEDCRNRTEKLAEILNTMCVAKKICFGESFSGGAQSEPYELSRKKDIVRLPFDFRNYHWVIEVTKPICHAFCAAVMVEGKLYISGGRMVNGGENSPEAVTNIWSFNVQSMEWRHSAYMNYARIHHSAIAISKEIFFIGGVDEKLRILPSVDVFDITTGNVCQLLPMSVPRAGASAIYYNSYLWVCGGLVEPSHLDCSCLVTTVERFNFEFNSWETIRSLRIPRAFGTLIEYRGQLLLIGGVAANAKKSSSSLIACDEVDVLTTRQNMWCLHSKLLQPRHCATLLVSGYELYVVGGVSLRTENMVTTIEKYDRKFRRWRFAEDEFSFELGSSLGWNSKAD